MTRIRFEDLPSTNTPINAENLNKLNNVIVSSEEPTTGEEVWLQRSRNLYNDNASTTPYFYNGSGVKELDGDGNTYIETVIENPSSKYVVSFTSLVGSAYMRFIFFDNYTFISRILSNTSGDIISVPANATRMIISTNKNETMHFNNLQIEDGEVATEYEPYTPKKIHTKNDNGVYEEFYNEEEHKEFILFDGEPTTGEVSLKDSVSRYKYIEVFYYTYPSTFSSIKVPSNASNISCVLIDFDLTYPDNHGFVLQFKHLINNDTRLTVGGKGRLYKYQNATDITQDTQNQIYVSKVVGYK